MTTDKNNLEIKVLPSGDVLRFFCIQNAQNIIACEWYDTKYCLKTCKFYEGMENEVQGKRV